MLTYAYSASDFNCNMLSRAGLICTEHGTDNLQNFTVMAHKEPQNDDDTPAAGEAAPLHGRPVRTGDLKWHN